MADPDDIDLEASDRLAHVTEIVSAFVSNNPLAPRDLPRLIAETHRALRGLSANPVQLAEQPLLPAVPIKKSVSDDFLVCLDDGKRFKSLKRHLAGLGMTPDDYRAKWGLSPDYPMVAPNYATTRSALAKAIGLGRKNSTIAKPKRGPKTHSEHMEAE